MNKRLAELIDKKQQASTSEAPIDWDQRRSRYTEAVNSLYASIREILAEPIASGGVKWEPRSKTLTEGFIGTYSIDDLMLTVGNEQIRFSPRGRNIVGAEGRVDVVGERGEVTLILQNNCWLIVKARQPQLVTATFDESSLADILQSIMRELDG